MIENTGIRTTSAYVPPAFWPPMIWKSIIAGTVVGLAMQLILTLLGAGIGAAMTIPPTDPAAHHPGTAAVLWLICSGMLSFGVGGYVAGVTSGMIHTGGGAAHGMLSWALSAVLGAALTAIVGSATLGGMAAGAGAAAPSYAHATITPGLSREQVALPRQSALTNAPDDRAQDDPQVRASAQRAAEFTARVSLWTGFAFLLSMVAAGIGGALGRQEHGVFFPIAPGLNNERTLAGAV